MNDVQLRLTSLRLIEHRLSIRDMLKLFRSGRATLKIPLNHETQRLQIPRRLLMERCIFRAEMQLRGIVGVEQMKVELSNAKFSCAAHAVAKVQIHFVLESV